MYLLNIQSNVANNDLVSPGIFGWRSVRGNVHFTQHSVRYHFSHARLTIVTSRNVFVTSSAERKSSQWDTRILFWRLFPELRSNHQK